MNAIQYFDWGADDIKYVPIRLYTVYTNPVYKNIHIFNFSMYVDNGISPIYSEIREYAPLSHLYMLPNIQMLTENLGTVLAASGYNLLFKVVKIEWVLATKTANYNAISGNIKAQINNDSYSSVIIEEKLRRDDYVFFSVFANANNMMKKYLRKVTLIINP